MKKYSAQRIKSIPESIFSTMSRMAFEYNAVNLGQGFPDFDGPYWLMEKAFEAMKTGKNQYAPSPGILSLRKAFAEVQNSYHGIDWDPENNITITAGATEALYSTFQALIDPGDEVILFEPFYDSYQADVLLAGGIPKYVTLNLPDFSFNPEYLKETISTRTKMIVINTPNNPTGKLFSKEELQFIAELAIQNDLIVVSDEVYEFLTFENEKHIPIASIDGMKNRTISISSCGKTFGMTGWKIGFASACDELTKAIRSVHQWTTFAVNTPAQHSMAYGFKNLEEYLPEFRKTYQAKRDLIYNELLTTQFRPHKPMGSYFIMIDLPDGRFKDDKEAAEILVKEYGVATIPPSVFYNNSEEGSKMLRLCFAKSDNTLIEGVERLRRVK